MLKQVGLVHNHVFFRKAAIEWAIAAGDFQRCVELAERHGLLRIIPANQCMSILTGGCGRLRRRVPLRSAPLIVPIVELFPKGKRWTLARAHARSGADQNERDFAALQAAVASGRVKAETGL